MEPFGHVIVFIFHNCSFELQRLMELCAKCNDVFSKVNRGDGGKEGGREEGREGGKEGKKERGRERRREGSWVDGRTDGWTDGQPDFSKQILNVCVCLFRSAINSTSPNLSFKRF